uniref:Minor capsid protein P8 central region domain-containing protein n=1 Tax=viral metagenome TaxID=1070528 RepID=A0A6C0BVQ1_9ZZZZ
MNSTLYQTQNPNGANYQPPLGDPNTFSANIRDIDKSVVYQDDNGVNFFDFDILSKPTVSGTGNIIQPSQTDRGFPEFTTDINSEGDIQVQDLISGNESVSLGSMVDTVNNGRVGDIEILNTELLNKGEADIVINKDNQQTSVKGIIENTALSDIFFSDLNFDVIQKTIRYNVFNATENVVSEQSKNELYIIMRSIMLQYGNFRVSSENLLNEIRELNKRVVDYCSQNVVSNVTQYLGYIKDIEKLPTPMDRPVSHGKQNYTYDISNLL